MNVETAPRTGAHWQALVADDDDDTLTLMSIALRRAGFEVHESSDGEELLQTFAACTTARTLVVSDIGMPRCGGIEATIRVRKLAPHTPVLLVSAFGDPRTLGDAKSAGADQIIQKPLNLDHLVRAALELISRDPT